MTNKANSVHLGNRPLHIAIGAGHHNADGGTAAEVLLTGEICAAVVDLSRASTGFEIRCYTPDDGLGMHPGPVGAAPSCVARSWDPLWTVDIFHEVHTDAAPSPEMRGICVVYPDHPESGDVDEDVRKQGPTMAAILSRATSLPLGGTAGCGILGERRTWVGRQGKRLAVFSATATESMRDHSCRFISEVGYYTNTEDRKVLDREDFPQRQAAGILRVRVLGRQVYGLDASFRGSCVGLLDSAHAGYDDPSMDRVGSPN